MWSAAIVVTCALSMLGRSERHFHPINLVQTLPPEASRNAEGFVTHGPPTIHLVISTAVFRDAAAARSRCGAPAALAKLASIIVHEEWHLRNGPDERSAYLAQLTALAALGYGEGTLVYSAVKRSMLSRLQTPPQIASLGVTGAQR